MANSCGKHWKEPGGQKAGVGGGGGEAGRQTLQGQIVDPGAGLRGSCLSRQAWEEGPLGDVSAGGSQGGPRVAAEV